MGHPPNVVNLTLGQHWLADFFAPGFQILFHLSHELIGDGAIDQAVIVTEREVNDAAK